MCPEEVRVKTMILSRSESLTLGNLGTDFIGQAKNPWMTQSYYKLVTTYFGFQ